ncbi:MAG: glycosyltransferase family 9 protein [Ignavibacteria bacterium]|nr:glycosyltransferase family 9 protein [Ignavibacteria bacterium]
MQKRILIVRTDRVGDVVMITPMIRELRKTFPDSFIATLTTSNTKDILLNNPYLDLTITDDKEKNSFLKVVKEIRKHKFTDGLLVMPTERAAYQMFLGGIKNRIGVGRKLYEVITFMKSVSRNKYIPLRHEADYCMDLARKIGVKTENIIPEIFLTGEEISETKNFFLNNGINNDEFKIIVHTGSKNSSPNWSEDKYLELIKGILKKYNSKKIKIILTALEMSDGFLNSINNLKNPSIVDLSGKVNSLRHLINTVYCSDFIVVSSTGPAHLADALGKKGIVIYCKRRMSCVKHWGTQSMKICDLEVSEEHCSKFCSSDKEICDIENGVSVDEVLKNINP